MVPKLDPDTPPDLLIETMTKVLKIYREHKAKGLDDPLLDKMMNDMEEKIKELELALAREN